MSVIVELDSDFGTDKRVRRISMSRVPVVGETIRELLLGADDLLKVGWFRVIRVVHNVNSETFPRRRDELDAWVFSVSCEEVWR